jgi:HSP20 family protein
MLPLLFNDLERVLFAPETAPERRFAPQLDVYEYADRFELKLDAPGLQKTELKLGLEDGILTIEGERKQEKLPEGVKGRFERWTGSFARTIRLPEDVDTNAIEASLKDGVLAVTIKKIPARKPVEITVK